MATAILDADSGVTGGNAVVRYSGILTPLAENDTIGITIGADVELHTVPAGGQTLYEALTALAVLGVADGHAAFAGGGDDFDQCLRVRVPKAVGVAPSAAIVIATPVYVVA